MTSQTRPHGVGDCPTCDKRVLFAYGPDGKRAALDPAPGGGLFAVAWDANWVPTFRPVPGGGQLALGEHLFAQHPADCGRGAVVRPITAARSSRHRRAPARRTAHAR
jgi:hypothetical protein